MTPRQWLALFFFYISYLLFGASIFYHIERDLELNNYGKELQRRIDVNEILMKYTDSEYRNEVLQIVGDYCGKPVTNFTEDPFQPPLTWSFYHAFFFAFTVCSTVGYGNISPSSTLGRMIMIFYALIGIPMNGFLFAYLGDFFGKVFITAYERYKAYKLSTNKNYIPHHLGLIAQIVLYLIPGILIFLFLPSLIFSYFEDWSYSVAIYYSFVTLSTIGFGDFVPTFKPRQEEEFGFMFYIYEVFIIFWFIFGLGYLVMIMGFIAKGLRSKHITRLEHQLAENIKATQSRIWNGVTKDVSYLRRILNEVYMMKFRSNYPDDVEPEECINRRRTSSCPDLTIYRPNSEPMRKRAQSLFYPDDEVDPNLFTLHRVQSENDVNKADRNQPFDANQPTELLARVFTALGNIKAADDEAQSIAAMSMNMNMGVHGFSDSQILASEKQHDSRWSIPYSDTSFSIAPPRARARAASDFRAPVLEQLRFNESHDWTWSGNDQQIEEFRRLRKMNKKKPLDLYRAALTLPKSNSSVTVNIDDGTVTSAMSSTRDRSPSIFERLNPFKKRDDSRTTSLSVDEKNYLEQTSYNIRRGSRLSAISPHQNGLTPSMKRRVSAYSAYSANDENNANVLENTTIADLIRALEVMHTQAIAGDEPSLENLLRISRPRFLSESQTPQMTLNATQQPLPLINIFPPNTPTQLNERRSSMRPFSTSNTPLANRANRRQSAIVDLPSTRRSSLLVPPTTGPPPYSENTPRSTHRRFSVRPTLLSIPPGQSPMPSIQAVSSLQKRLSMRPSPLTTDYGTIGGGPPQRLGRSISTGSYSSLPMDTSSMSSPNTLTPVTKPRFNVSQNRLSRQLFSPSIHLDRKRSDSSST